MFNCFSAFLAIIGTVIGSGFISGKEIVVFFSRFGYWSFPCILISFFLFFFIFKFLLTKGERAVKQLENSKFYFILNLFLCAIFSSSMFAGTIDMAKGCGKLLTILFILFLLIICARVSKKGINSLNKINFLLVPIMTVILITAIIFQVCQMGQIQNIQTNYKSLSIIYCLLYVVLNTSNGCFLISSVGQKLSLKQKTRVAFFSALVLCLILSIINIVLLANPNSFNEEMPLLALFSGFGRQVLSFAIMIGCLTTLFSLIYSLSSSMRGLCKNEYLIFFVSVITPFILSLFGFGFIVSYLYPVASVIGIFLLGKLAFISFFKGTDKKIHSYSKNTK